MHSCTPVSAPPASLSTVLGDAPVQQLGDRHSTGLRKCCCRRHAPAAVGQEQGAVAEPLPTIQAALKRLPFAKTPSKPHLGAQVDINSKQARHRRIRCGEPRWWPLRHWPWLLAT